jgi:hypothetical protein
MSEPINSGASGGAADGTAVIMVDPTAVASAPAPLSTSSTTQNAVVSVDTTTAVGASSPTAASSPVTSVKNESKSQNNSMSEGKKVAPAPPQTPTPPPRHHLHSQHHQSHLPWGALKERPLAVSSSSLNERLAELEHKKPGEYLMHLIVFNFVQTSSRKLEQITNEKRVSSFLRPISSVYTKS